MLFLDHLNLWIVIPATHKLSYLSWDECTLLFLFYKSGHLGLERIIKLFKVSQLISDRTEYKFTCKTEIMLTYYGVLARIFGL